VSLVPTTAPSPNRELSDAGLRAAERDAYRTALADGRPITGAEPGRRFGLSDRWGRARMAEVRSESDRDGRGPANRDRRQPHRDTGPEHRDSTTHRPRPASPQHTTRPPTVTGRQRTGPARDDGGPRAGPVVAGLGHHPRSSPRGCRGVVWAHARRRPGGRRAAVDRKGMAHHRRRPRGRRPAPRRTRPEAGSPSAPQPRWQSTSWPSTPIWPPSPDLSSPPGRPSPSTAPIACYSSRAATRRHPDNREQNPDLFRRSPTRWPFVHAQPACLRRRRQLRVGGGSRGPSQRDFLHDIEACAMR
jgi:hypothetical protein